MSGTRTGVPAEPGGGAPGRERGERGEREAAPLRTCPNCGSELTARSCKLLCPNPECGYFLSCSDYL